MKGEAWVASGRALWASLILTACLSFFVATRYLGADDKVRNVVFMGMGEPLDNYDAVIGAVRAMTDVQRFSLSPRRISVSTVGVVPRLRSLVHDAPGVRLALSLHAPNQELRTQIVSL